MDTPSPEQITGVSAVLLAAIVACWKWLLPHLAFGAKAAAAHAAGVDPNDPDTPNEQLIDLVKTSVDSLRDEVAHLRSRVEKLEAERDQLRDDLERLRRENAALVEENTELRRHIVRLERRLGEINDELDAA